MLRLESEVEFEPACSSECNGRSLFRNSVSNYNTD